MACDAAGRTCSAAGCTGTWGARPPAWHDGYEGVFPGSRVQRTSRRPGGAAVAPSDVGAVRHDELRVPAGPVPEDTSLMRSTVVSRQ